MGFDCSISRVKKIRDDYTLEEFIKVNNYLRWKNNSWNFEERKTQSGEVIQAPYPTYEKYWRSNCLDENEKFPGIPSDEEIAFYQEIYTENLKESSYNDAITTIDFWGSGGRYFDGDLIHILNKVDDYNFGPFTKDKLNETLEYVNAELEDCKLIPVIINYSYKINNGYRAPLGMGEDIILNKCDGIIAEDVETGNERRIPTNGEEGELVYVPSRNFDEDKYYALLSLKEVLIKILNIDLDKEFVWYERSW